MKCSLIEWNDKKVSTPDVLIQFSREVIAFDFKIGKVCSIQIYLFSEKKNRKDIWDIFHILVGSKKASRFMVNPQLHLNFCSCEKVVISQRFCLEKMMQ